LRLKDSLRPSVRFAVAATRAGGAWMGVALLVSAPGPVEVLAALIGCVVLVGGIASTARRPLAVRLAGCGVVVVLARAGLGPAAAAATAGLLTLGWWIRMSALDAVTGLAIFGVGASVMGMASLRLIAGFWAIGALSTGVLHARRAWRRRLRIETSSADLSPAITRQVLPPMI
jgi:hypothetical protein